ncbi:MAG: helix-turn-helix transcriptional regulator [Rhodanobacteraceae bacterium]
MKFATIHPGPPLASLIESIWDWDAPAAAHRFERMLPLANASLIINLAEDETRVYDDDAMRRCESFGGAALDAPRHRSFVIDTAEQVRVMGVVFRCGAAAAFFRERMDTIANAHVDLDDLVSARFRGVRERLLDARGSRARIATLCRWLVCVARDAAMPRAVVHAVAFLRDAPALARVADVCRESGYSQRRFGTLFREHVGMSPKRYARMQRFRAVVDSVQHGRRVEWTRVAHDCGFYDQPHLVREFRAFSGMTPTEYAAQRGEYANHVPLADA